jgi:hypothetical protein
MDAALLTGLDELVEQARAEPESLPAVRDDETDVDHARMACTAPGKVRTRCRNFSTSLGAVRSGSPRAPAQGWR